MAQFQKQLVKVGKMQKRVKGFSPMYVGGEDWYTALSFVFDYGGSIAKFSRGKWHGTLNSKASIAGLTRFKQFFKATQSRSRPRPMSLPPMSTWQAGRAPPT